MRICCLYLQDIESLCLEQSIKGRNRLTALITCFIRSKQFEIKQEEEKEDLKMSTTLPKIALGAWSWGGGSSRGGPGIWKPFI